MGREGLRRGGHNGAMRCKELGLGIFGLTRKERVENSRKAGEKGGKTTRERGVGIFGLTRKERAENARKNSWKIIETMAKRSNAPYIAKCHRGDAFRGDYRNIQHQHNSGCGGYQSYPIHWNNMSFHLINLSFNIYQ